MAIMSDEVFIASPLWWEGHRPANWNTEEHLDSPTVNCKGETEVRLALAIANHVRLLYGPF